MKKASGKVTDKELATEYGVSRETIVRVKKRWRPTVQAAQVYALSKALEVQKERRQAILPASGVHARVLPHHARRASHTFTASTTLTGLWVG